MKYKKDKVNRWILHTNQEFNYMNQEFDPRGTKSIKMTMTIFILHVSNSAILSSEMKYFGKKTLFTVLT